MVDICTRHAPGASAAAAPSGPNSTPATAPASVSIVITTAAPRAARAGVGAALAPAVTSAAARSGVRSQTCTWWPAASSRPAIGAPMRPSPRHAIVVMAVTLGRHDLCD